MTRIGGTQRTQPTLGFRWIEPAYLVAAIGATSLAATGRVPSPKVLSVLGPTISPALVLPVVAAGGIALHALEPWKDSSGATGGWKTSLVVVGGAAGLAAVAILFDLGHPYGADTNVPWPGSMLTYPVVAVLAEASLHLVPLAVLAKMTDRRLSHRGGRLGWTLLVPVACIEAAFQMAAGSTNRWFTGLLLFVIGLTQLGLFRRHGFVAMLSFRMVYYAIWHIVWGAVRLRLLF